MGLVLVILMVICVVIWINGLLNWDGKCHGDCDSCMYDCTEEEKSKIHADFPVSNTVETEDPKNRIK